MCWASTGTPRRSAVGSANARAFRRWAVAERPRPNTAAASAKVPVHTDTTRSDRFVRGHVHTLAAEGDGVNDGNPSDPAIRHTGPVAASDVDWSERADIAERAIVRRHLRRLAGVLPGTRIGRVRWPRRRPAPLGPWHYWWQAHLLDCLIDAQLRAPTPQRAQAVAALVRGVRLRNGGSWLNRYYDDIAWLGLAIQRGGSLAGRSGPFALAAITARLHEGWTEGGGGGIWWRRDDDFKAAPANGPAAILLARDGQSSFAAAIADWMAETLVDPESGLVRDGVRIAPDGGIRLVEPYIYTYNQGVFLGACVELAVRDGHQRWTDRAIALVDAVRQRLAGPDGVLPGSGGGDGGLFAGITVRYLADAATRVAALAEPASQMVFVNADAVWKGRAEVRGGPVFSAEWRDSAAEPRAGTAEADLSVQLSGWMLLEAAARLQVAGFG
jgi:predicted alpha-1,6-mannanase (GH76 family)